MNTININAAFNLRFVCRVEEYEAVLINLRRMGFAPEYCDVTKENSPLTFAEGRPEIQFIIPVKNVQDAAFARQIINRS